MLGQRMRFYFERDDPDLDPKMHMRKPVEGGGTMRAATIMGRGRDRYVRAAGASQQRATVKTKVVSAAKAKAHARYLGKSEAGLDSTDVTAFSATQEGIDLKAMAAGWSDDRHYFQQILSPEHGDQLAMPRYVRSVVHLYERDLGTTLTWCAVIHYDTDHPHAHLMIRGVDDRGGDLVIDREYIRHGMRARAMEVATRELGPRSAHEIAVSLEKRRRDLEAGHEVGRMAGWELHLNVPVDRWHPTTQAVLKDLAESGLSYQMQFAADKTKRLTVSVGAYDDAVKVARDLDAKFGNRIPDQTGKIVRDDVRLAGHVWGSFNAHGDQEFTRWAVKGVPLGRDSAAALRGLKGEERTALCDELRTEADARLIAKYREHYAGTERVQALEKAQDLQRGRDQGHGY
jgi:hypothetical protein